MSIYLADLAEVSRFRTEIGSEKQTVSNHFQVMPFIRGAAAANAFADSVVISDVCYSMYAVVLIS